MRLVVGVATALGIVGPVAGLACSSLAIAFFTSTVHISRR